MKLIIEVIKIPDNEGGGYSACVPELGRCAVLGDGDTPIQAISDMIRHCPNEITKFVEEE